MMMIKLYHVSSDVKEKGEFRGYTFEGYTINWYVDGRDTPLVPFGEAIRDYDPCDPPHYTEGYIKELFSIEEANLLKDYLNNRPEHYIKTTIEEVPLPVSDNMMGYGAIPIGGPDLMRILFDCADYKLPFRVCGHYYLA